MKGWDSMIRIHIEKQLAKKQLKLYELAAIVGMTNANLSHLKTGKAKAIRFSTLMALCKTLDCQPGDLLQYVPDDDDTE